MRKELVAASAEPLILSLLAQGESYGYAIIQDIKARSRQEIQWTDGMLYPVLHRLEGNGWIKSRWAESENGRKRKYYTISREGKKALAAQREEWMSVNRVMESFGEASHV
jgi:PadR family transcriptional regulator PadR